MLTNSCDIIRRLEREKWLNVRTTDSHHVFKHPENRNTVVIPPRRRIWEKVWFVPFMREQDGSLIEIAMTHYIAIIEEAEPNLAVGIWFPDLPGCTTAGDNIDDALRNAPEALELYADSVEEEGQHMPRARTLTELKSDPSIADDISAYMVSLIELSARVHAAE